MLPPPEGDRLELFQGKTLGVAGRSGAGACPGARRRVVLDDTPIDLRGLDPPEPLMRVLDTVEHGAGPYVFLLSRDPAPLYALLVAGGWKYAVSRDGRGVLVTVTRR